MIPNMTINSCPVLAFIQTETQNDGNGGQVACGIILAEWRPGVEWVTAWYRMGDSGWDIGHYIRDLNDAYASLIARALKNMDPTVRTAIKIALEMTGV